MNIWSFELSVKYHLNLKLTDKMAPNLSPFSKMLSTWAQSYNHITGSNEWTVCFMSSSSYHLTNKCAVFIWKKCPILVSSASSYDTTHIMAVSFTAYQSSVDASLSAQTGVPTSTIPQGNWISSRHIRVLDMEGLKAKLMRRDIC